MISDNSLIEIRKGSDRVFGENKEILKYILMTFFFLLTITDNCSYMAVNIEALRVSRHNDVGVNFSREFSAVLFMSIALEIAFLLEKYFLSQKCQLHPARLDNLAPFAISIVKMDFRKWTVRH